MGALRHDAAPPLPRPHHTARVRAGLLQRLREPVGGRAARRVHRPRHHRREPRWRRCAREEEWSGRDLCGRQGGVGAGIAVDGWQVQECCWCAGRVPQEQPFTDVGRLGPPWLQHGDPGPTAASHRTRADGRVRRAAGGGPQRRARVPPRGRAADASAAPPTGGLPTRHPHRRRKVPRLPARVHRPRLRPSCVYRHPGVGRGRGGPVPAVRRRADRRGGGGVCAGTDQLCVRSPVGVGRVWPPAVSGPHRDMTRIQGRGEVWQSERDVRGDGGWYWVTQFGPGHGSTTNHPYSYVHAQDLPRQYRTASEF
eukprot:m.324796 g.324796  ORF g.324796 m.324796 type:complete len:310 (+) comp27636_c0_seq2:577-1506(+)